MSSSIFANTVAGTLGFTVQPPGYTIQSTGLAPIITSDGYSIYRFHNNGSMNISNINAFGTATLQIMCVGGGSYGRGEAISGSPQAASVAGAGGGFVESTILLTTDQTINIVIGAGGSGNISSIAPYQNGENSIVSFSINNENNIIAYGGNSSTGNSGAPQSNLSGFRSFTTYNSNTSLASFQGGGAGAGGPGNPATFIGGSNGSFAWRGGDGGPGKKPTLPGIATQYPNTYWAAGGGGAGYRVGGGGIYPTGGHGGIGGGGAGYAGGGQGELKGGQAYSTATVGMDMPNRNASPNTGSGSGALAWYGGTDTGTSFLSGGSGIVMIAIKNVP